MRGHPSNSDELKMGLWDGHDWKNTQKRKEQHGLPTTGNHPRAILDGGDEPASREHLWLGRPVMGA